MGCHVTPPLIFKISDFGKTFTRIYPNTGTTILRCPLPSPNSKRSRTAECCLGLRSLIAISFSLRLRGELNLLRPRGSVNPNNPETPAVGPGPKSHLARGIGRVKRWVHRVSKRIASRIPFSLPRHHGAGSGSSLGANPTDEAVNALPAGGITLSEAIEHSEDINRSGAIGNFEKTEHSKPSLSDSSNPSETAGNFHASAQPILNRLDPSSRPQAEAIDDLTSSQSIPTWSNFSVGIHYSEAIDSVESDQSQARDPLEVIHRLQNIHRPGGPDRSDCELRPTESNSSDSSVSGGVPL
ncbi:hypothetical protein N7528_000490 [Penicillium herquei]|nr:hypothetical protein N7528_000490 [Penicillium herquei]